MSVTFEKKGKTMLRGFRDGIPIGLGYFAVAFSLGIDAKSVGLTPFQGFIASLFTSASAGEHAGFMNIRLGAALWEAVLMLLIANARYLLMSIALGQRFEPGTKLVHRLMVGAYITDELFGITIARPGYIHPYYTYGAILIAVPMWALGTLFGVVMGQILPANVVSALSVALYGMFIAIFVPPARKDRVVFFAVLASFLFSFACGRIPCIADNVSEGTRTIVLTVLISAAAAALFPVKEEKKEEKA